MRNIDIQILTPICSNKNLLVENANSVLFRNVGGADASVDGNLTLKSGEVIAFGASENTVFRKNFVISFLSQNNPRIEIVLTKYI